jgi:NADH dehydrogenase
MKVVVAGASGFVGRHVADGLRARGHAVLGIDRGTRPVSPGVVAVRCDLACEDVPTDVFAGADAVVNLVGIKRPTARQGFEEAHVTATRRLVEGARRAGVGRFVHLSVVCARPDPRLPYHDTKWRAEQLVRDSGLAATILRPGVIYGAGDEMVTHLVKMIRFAPIFPVVGRGGALLQPVDVRDVALTVCRVLERPETAGHAYDVVGPERLRLRDVVRTVAQGTGLPLAIVPTPVVLMRPAVALMSAVSARTISTPSQLRMLEDGMVGDPAPAGADIGLQPRAFDAEAVRALAPAIPPLFGASLRFASDRAEQTTIAGHRPFFSRAVGLAAAGVTLMPLAGLLLGNAWYRMALCGALLVAASFAFVPLPWGALLTVTRRGVLQGLAAATVLYGIGAVVFHLLQKTAGGAAQIAQLYGWRDTVPAGFVIPLLVLIVMAEEIVWRNAVTLPFAARLGPIAGVLLAAFAFSAAHVSLGVPVLLLAALGAGAFWSALVVKTRSAIPALVSHVLWDLAVLFLLPYGGG